MWLRRRTVRIEMEEVSLRVDGIGLQPATPKQQESTGDVQRSPKKFDEVSAFRRAAALPNLKSASEEKESR